MTVTIDDLYTRLKSLFSNSEDELTPTEQAIATAAFTQAQNVVKSELLLRGATAAQILLWLRLDEFYMDIATFYTIKDLGKDRDGSDKHDAWSKVFDRRKELKSVDIVLSDGVIVVDEDDKDQRPIAIMNLKDMNDDLGL